MASTSTSSGLLMLILVQLNFDYSTAHKSVSREQVVRMVQQMGPVKIDLPNGKFIFGGDPQCSPGFEFQSQSGYCVDINECGQGTHNCTHAALCVNRAGSFECADLQRRPLNCPFGYKYNWHINECLEIDECFSNPCDAESVCINQIGGFQCLSKTDTNCPNGYQFRPKKGCWDIDECEKPNLCEENENCVNLQGSYMCIDPCAQGFIMLPFQWECLDIDECEDDTNSCAQKEEDCINTHGGYHCEKSER